jgi:hypothetical protein
MATERGGVGRNTKNVSQMHRAVSATTIIAKITTRRPLSPNKRHVGISKKCVSSFLRKRGRRRLTPNKRLSIPRR